MPRSCTVCSHPKREEIDRAIAAGIESNRAIASEYSIHVGSLRRHVVNHLPRQVAKAREIEQEQRSQAIVREHNEADETQAAGLITELTLFVQRVRLLYDACDAWLRDADDPSKYDIAPRSEDVMVTYLEHVDSRKTVKKKAALSQLLERALRPDQEVVFVETKAADPRELLLKTFDRLKSQLELVAELEGKLDRRQHVNIEVSVEWVNLRNLIFTTLRAYPEAVQTLAEALRDRHGDAFGTVRLPWNNPRGGDGPTVRAGSGGVCGSGTPLLPGPVAGDSAAQPGTAALVELQPAERQVNDDRGPSPPPLNLY